MNRDLDVSLIGTEAQANKRWKPQDLLLAALLLVTLLLGACNANSGGEAAADATPIVQAQEEAESAADAEEVDIEEDDVTTETATGDADVEDVAVITDTELITGTEVTTDVTLTTDTVVIEENVVTTVVTDTDVVTNVVESSDSTTTSESDVITDTADLPSQSSAGEADTTPQPGQQGSQTAPETTSIAPFTGIEGSTGRSIRASTLLDADFETSDGDVGGEIQDLVIDIQNGQVLYVLLEYGGVLDVGDTDMPVPLSAFSWGSEDELILNIDGQQLENFPGVSNDWPVPDDNNWDLDVRSFWEGIGIDTGFEAEQSMQGVRRASSLVGGTIAGGELGDRVVQDMIISVGEGRVSYVLIADAGAGAGDGWYVVPFSAFDATAPEAGLTLNPDFDMGLFDQAPRFDGIPGGNEGL